ncbi:hypothetical protein ACJMK2_010205 [Sinanodonta woodiana]|uniref:G-protein coupled receptors family 1 profile domain-containing protein n=1 Tax=Sinanodonta woodiana TaxID=1069815 RepID=A0ABD3VHK8_SINWO
MGDTRVGVAVVGEGAGYPRDYTDAYSDYDSFMLELSPEQKFIKYLYLCLFPLFLLFGTVGNVATMLLLNKYSHNVWSTCLYMTILLLLDLVKLYVECGNDWYAKLFDDMYNLSQEILLLSSAVCKVYMFLYSLTIHTLSWIMVAMAIEVTIGVRYPYSIYKMCTRDRATAVVLLITVLLLTLNLHFFWTTGLTVPGDDHNIRVLLCTYINELSDHFRDVIWPLINLLIGDLIPMIITIVCLILSIQKLKNMDTQNKEQLELNLEKYFLDIKSLQELKLSFTIVYGGFAIVSFFRILNDALNYLVTNNVIKMELDTVNVIRAITSTFTYAQISLMFWVFYLTCEKFKKDIKSTLNKICCPFTKRYQVSHTKTCILNRHEKPMFLNYDATNVS